MVLRNWCIFNHLRSTRIAPIMMETKKQDVISSPRPGQIPTSWNYIFMIYRHIQYMIHPFSKARAISTTVNHPTVSSILYRSAKTIVFHSLVDKICWGLEKRKNFHIFIILKFEWLNQIDYLRSCVAVVKVASQNASF